MLLINCKPTVMRTTATIMKMEAMIKAEPLEFFNLGIMGAEEGVSCDKAKKPQKALENRESLDCGENRPIYAAPRIEVFQLDFSMKQRETWERQLRRGHLMK